jgi:hypothetical protein
MHQKTYDRLFDQATELESKASQALMRKFGKLLQLTAHLEKHI